MAVEKGAENGPLDSLRFAWPFVWHVRRDFYLVAAATAALTIVELAIPLLSRAYLDSITGNLRRFEALIEATSPTFLIALMVALGVGRGLLLARQRALTGSIGLQVAARLRSTLWAHLGHLPLEHTQRRGSGRLLVRFISDIRAVQRVASMGLVQGPADLLQVICVLLVIALMDWRLALPSALLLPIYALIFWKLNPRLRSRSRATRRRLTHMSSYLDERIGGMKLVKASTQQAGEARVVRKLNRGWAQQGARQAATAAAFDGATAAALSCAIALALWLAGAEYASGSISNGTLVAFVLLLGLSAPALRRLVGLNRSLQMARVSIDRLQATLSQSPEGPPESRARRLRVTEGELRVKRVSFSYPDGRNALQQVSLRASRGELVALVGPNGAGKSTLLDLIMRFRVPSTGRVVVDGRDLANVTVDSLRQAIGWVPQDALLFDGSIAENITYGVGTASSGDDLQRVVRLAGVDEVEASLPAGLRTRVGPSGQALSAGQRQRVALARALMTDPQILLLDEVSSGVDPGAEQRLARCLRQLADSKTVLVVTHRLPTLLLADRIYLLEGGRIVEKGRHSELSSAGGAYARLFGRERALTRA